MERRSFLKNFTLTGVLAAFPLIKSFANNTQPVQTITGRVHSKGKGIANVAVTDGKHIVLTDKKGHYELPFSDISELVYISLPSGYEIPAVQGVAKFYHPVSKDNNRTYDFELTALATDDKKHCFLVWADTQIISKADAQQLKSESAADVKQLVASYPAGTLFHGIGCGDLVWDKFELFPDYKEALALTGIPFYNVIGNHDMDISSRTDEYSAETFKKEFGPTYYSFNRGDIHYVVLDDVFFIGTAKKYIGYITENQLSWLEKDLVLVKPGSTVVVSLHIPTNTGAARRTKKAEEFGGTVSNRKQLYKLLAPYKVHIMSGHTHFNESWQSGNIMEHNHGTVCGAWWTGPVCGDGTPNGYGVYEVNGSDIQWYYKSTGKPKNHQLRLYGKEKSAGGNEITANVWNWDEGWNVEWFEDGVSKGTMQQRIGLDPLAVELYDGPELPKKHRFVEPVLADHLFYAVPAATAKKITVKATDRFGNVYTEELEIGNPG